MNEPKTILLAEDDANDVELTLTALAEQNLAKNVQVVRDGTEALDYLFSRGKFAKRPPGDPLVVLLDLKMPKVSGLEVLAQIKADPTLKLVPIVALTSSRESSDVKHAYEYGVNAYVVKPVRFSEFISAVKDLGIFWAVVNQAPQDS